MSSFKCQATSAMWGVGNHCVPSGQLIKEPQGSSRGSNFSHPPTLSRFLWGVTLALGAMCIFLRLRIAPPFLRDGVFLESEKDCEQATVFLKALWPRTVFRARKIKGGRVVLCLP